MADGSLCFRMIQKPIFVIKSIISLVNNNREFVFIVAVFIKNINTLIKEINHNAFVLKDRKDHVQRK